MDLREPDLDSWSDNVGLTVLAMPGVILSWGHALWNLHTR